jgi:ataxia telangiectasia mutated family protein
LPELGVELLSDDAERLLEHCTEVFLQTYVYERSEVATGVILDIMSSLVTDWTNAGRKTLFELGIDMYEWYTTIALSGGVLSTSVQTRVATLLLQLCHIDADYGRDNDVPSVRTSLFKLVKHGSVSVLFHLANRISTIFGLFVLSNHNAMFDDLQDSLTQDSEWIEGIAMRLLFLAKLASAWHSLLRQCVYYIFETAGQVKESAAHANRAASELATSLSFDSPQELFHIFAPQLLYTWLESHTVSSLPFAAFQYESLDALIKHNQAELTAQLLFQGKDDGMQVIEAALKTNSTELVARSFAKCLAYCLAHDVKTSKVSGDESATRLRELLGKDEFKMRAGSQFPAVIGHMYLTMQQEDMQNKWLEKRQEYAAAAKALTEMKSHSHSEVALPDTQQPCFKSKYLCDQIDRLCRRGGLNAVQLWGPSSFSLTARVLFDSIEDALGPLHTCLIIRKLRLFIAMSGKAPFSALPLEMVIHTLRPFLSDSQCADDVIGLLQYLFHHGRDHLRAALPFLFGTVTLIILRMRKHSAARQESTTQESQHRQTVQKMQSFQTWLVKYLHDCYTSSGSQSSMYASLADMLGRVNIPGNAYKGSPESALLLLLIHQDGVDDDLLKKSDRDEALVLLSGGFVLPPAVTDDCLAEDSDCDEISQKLWSVMHIPGLNDSFIAWAANVVGRSYAYSGLRPINTSSSDTSTNLAQLESYKGVERSQAAIAQKLSAMLFSRTRRESSMADYTLRSIVHSFTNAEESIKFEQMLPATVVPAITNGTYGYIPRFTISSDSQQATGNGLHRVLQPKTDLPLDAWLIDFSLALCDEALGIAVLPALKATLQQNATLAREALPCMVHILLAREFDKKQTLRTELSAAIAVYFEITDPDVRPRQKYLLELLLYLRRHQLPGENTAADRLRWLDIDWIMAAQTAERCGMPTTALMFAESASTPQSGVRRSSSRVSLSQISLSQIPQELLLSVFKQIDEPDSFYGVEQPASLDSVLDRLDYEADGYKSLMFRSARTDTDLRHFGQVTPGNSNGLIRSLSLLNLDSVTFSLLNNGFASTSSSDALLDTARRLQQWDITAPTEKTSSAIAVTFTAFSELSRTVDKALSGRQLEDIIVSNTRLAVGDLTKNPSPQWLSGLAALVEARAIIQSLDESTLRANCDQMQARQQWMRLAPFDDFRLILSSRQTLFSIVARVKALSDGIGSKASRNAEINSLIQFSCFAREHGQQQEALTASSQLRALVKQAKELGLKADGAAMLETASVLWHSGEAVASVRMLRDTLALRDLDKEDVPVGRPGLLAQLAHQLAEARLEKPDDILADYLKPAIESLKGRVQGEEAGKVFHEFASFCDKQLQNPDNHEDFTRMERLRQRKLEEVEELHRLAKTPKRSAGHHDYEGAYRKQKRWFDIDDADYQKLKQSRDTFLEGSLRNYSLALRASDDHDISVLRLFAMWLENADDHNANKILEKQLPSIPSWKFVVLMNQLVSRLENDRSSFQASLKGLMERIGSEHPHHSLHHLYATTRPSSTMDAPTRSRYEVALDICKRIQSQSKTSQLLKSVFYADSMYNELAKADVEQTRSSSGIATKDVPAASKIAKTVPSLKVPPATITVPLRRDSTYDNVPVIIRFRSMMRLMSGNSKPKKLNAYATDGKEYVQLFKSGDDDLRQDAIMEQVFGEVSKMLQNHETTRRRNLHVRTYNVVPLSPRSGIIEFVPNTASLTEFLSAAHVRYHPKDIKYNAARDAIAGFQKNSLDSRVKKFKEVCDQLQPVLRHFFFERFKDPDEWFAKRTAYTRTTATISILGHVLGLGDRHCQNIMLDEKTGEVVHIDLGIAFEAGKVLPVPELVPFRLSRDVVDGMGITKTEGVFRRCCEFTMDALREDKDSIMTLLNVLRYDPLYTWSVSPLRAKRMQEQTERSAAEGDEGSSKKKEQEAGEADRALSIVEKKLSKTLSTAATVNELILQATDEKNLATLFHGWAAFF